MYQRRELDGRGHGAIATTAIRAGTCILRCEPTAAVPLDMATTCATCFAPGARRCGLCKTLHYCSRPCQLADWAVHAAECTYLAKHLKTNPMTPSLLLATRILRFDASLAAVDHLVANLNAHDPTKLDDYRAMGMLVLSIMSRMKLKTALPPLDRVVALFGQFNCNAFTMCTPEQVPVGIGMFPDAALLNHSCAPNCILVFHGRQLAIRTIRDVSIGEELTISYIELMTCQADRQAELETSYFFTCSCTRCSSTEDPATTELLHPLTDPTCVSDDELHGDALLSEVRRLEAKADGLEQAHDTRGALDCRLQAIQIARALYGPRHSAATLALETLANLITSTEHAAIITPSDIAHARAAYRTVLDNQARVYSPFEMEAFQGLCYFKYGRLLVTHYATTGADDAIAALRKACRLLALSHGDDAPLVQDAVGLLHDTQRANASR